MKVLVDMNLGPAWVELLTRAGHEAVHWSGVGDATATDAEILRWAAERGYVVFTHDLDFGAVLAATGTSSPSVLQVRAQDLLAAGLKKIVTEALAAHAQVLRIGALVTVDAYRSRARILPLR